MSELLVSVVTPTFNSAQSIARNLLSVNSQTYLNIEQIIIDNKSTDDTLGLVRSLGKRVRHIVSEKDRGIADAFNKGIQNSRGEIVAILNSDDEYYSSDVIQKVVRAFSEQHADIVFGDMYFEDSLLGSNVRRPLLCSIEEAMPFNHPAFFVRKSLYDRFGLFDVSYRFTMDFEWILRLYKSATELQVNAFYLDSGALVKMCAGGATWKFESRTADEYRRALQSHNLWTWKASYFWLLRKLKIQIKKVMGWLGLAGMVRWYRIQKWGKLKG